MQDHKFENSRDILHRRVRIKFCDPDALGECLKTTDYRPGSIEALGRLADREDWILALDKAIAWPDYAGDLQRTRKFLVHVDCYVNENDAFQKFKEAGPGEWVALVHVLASLINEPEQITSEDDCQYVTAGTLIIEKA